MSASLVGSEMCIRDSKKAIRQAFRPHQVAVGVSGGAEAMAKAAQALADIEGFAVARLGGKS
eukprot:8186169-Alexandrium_andersonii.AAC.1